ncbi:hypothetical protein A2U01_0070532, partial [Trifolium medium]|nr:hypothetical protein [Trifolium medium]
VVESESESSDSDFGLSSLFEEEALPVQPQTPDEFFDRESHSPVSDYGLLTLFQEAPQQAPPQALPVQPQTPDEFFDC